MAASSEIRYKIGADTSALSTAFVKAQSIAASAGKQIEKKLGMKDAFKGLMQGIGIGSVDAIADAVVKPFQVAYERARDLVNLTSRVGEIQTREIVATGGRKAAIDAMKREVNDLSRDINDQQKLVESLDNPIAKVNPMAANLLRDAEQELVAMKVRQVELQSQISVDTKLTGRATAEWSREQGVLQDLTEAELREAGEREKLQIRLNALVKEYARIVKAGNIGTDKERANVGQQFAIQNQMKILNEKAGTEMATTFAGLGAAIAAGGPDPDGKKKKPRPRGRSEMERIADRGAERAMQAEEAIRTGKSPAFVASLASQANRDLTKTGQKVQSQTALVKQQDAEALGSKLIEANQTLKQIEKNLTPTGTNQKK